MSSHLTGSSPNRSFPARKPRKGWKRRYYLQQRARQERLNCSRKWKGDDSSVHASTQNTTENCESCSTIVASEALLEGPSVNASVDLDNKELLPADGEREKDHSSEQVEGKEVEDDCSKENVELGALLEEQLVVDNS